MKDSIITSTLLEGRIPAKIKSGCDRIQNVCKIKVNPLNFDFFQKKKKKTINHK